MKGWPIMRGATVLLLLAPSARAEQACVASTAAGWQPVLKRGTERTAVEAAMSDKDPARQEKMLRQLTECGVGPGTPVKILKSGTIFDTVEVLDGSTKGCTGEFLRSSLGACPPETK